MAVPLYEAKCDLGAFPLIVLQAREAEFLKSHTASLHCSPASILEHLLNATAKPQVLSTPPTPAQGPHSWQRRGSPGSVGKQLPGPLDGRLRGVWEPVCPESPGGAIPSLTRKEIEAQRGPIHSPS